MLGLMEVREELERRAGEARSTSDALRARWRPSAARAIEELRAIEAELVARIAERQRDRSGDRSGRRGALRRSPEAEEGDRRRRARRRRLPGVPRAALGHGARQDQAGRRREEMRTLPTDPGLLIVSCDGAARGNPGPAGIGVQITDERRATSSPRSRNGIGETTNNVAEYTAALEGLRRAAELGARRVHLRSDSKLLIEQLAGRYQVKASHLRPLHARGDGGCCRVRSGAAPTRAAGARTARPIVSRTWAWTSGARARRTR